MVRKRKYVPREVWDVPGTPDQKKERYYLKKALEKDPNNSEILFFLGFSHLLTHEYDRAIGYFERGVRYSPGDKLLLENLAFAYLQKKDYKKARVAAQTGLKYYPGNPRLLYFLARVKMDGDQDPSGAKKLLERAIKKNINNPRISQGMAMVYFKTGETNRGIKILEDTTKKFPLYPDAYILLAEKYQDEKEDAAKAITLLNDLIKRVPAYGDTYLLLGDLYMDSGDYERAKKLYLMALKHNPESVGEIFVQLGKVNIELNRPEKALEYFKKVTESNEKNVEDSIEINSKLGLAEAYIMLKNFDKASKILDGLRADGDDNPELAICISDLEYARGNYKRALEILERIKSGKIQESEKRRILSEVKWRLSLIFRAMGDEKMSSRFLEEALRNAPRYRKDILRKKASGIR